MPEITLRFGKTLIEENPTGEHCVECGDVMFDKQFRVWQTCMNEPIKKLTLKRENGDELPFVCCETCKPVVAEKLKAKRPT